MTQDQLNQEIARAQAALDSEAADVNKQAAAVAAAQAKYLSHVKQTQTQIDASEGEAQRKVDQRRQVLAIIPGAVMSIAGQVATGHIDPMSLLGNLLTTLLPVVGTGALVDSVRARMQVQQLTKPWDGVDRRGGSDDPSPAGAIAGAIQPPAPSPLPAQTFPPRAA